MQVCSTALKYGTKPSPPIIEHNYLEALEADATYARVGAGGTSANVFIRVSVCRIGFLSSLSRPMKRSISNKKSMRLPHVLDVPFGWAAINIIIL